MRKGPTRPLHVPALALGIAALGGGLVTGTFLASPAAPAAVVSHLKAPQQYVVAIMPGHGGVDPGAISPFNGLREKNVTLAMGLDLRRDLEAQGVKVVMTRTTDTDVTIKRAAQVASQAHAKVLLSLWVNDWTDDSLEGATVFMPHARDVRLAKQLSKGMAAAIAPKGMGDRGTEMLPQLWVHTPMPAVTIEVGFMSNQQDSELLADSSFRQTVAQGLDRGVLAYAPQIERIDTRLIAYRRAGAKAAAARKALAARQLYATQLGGWSSVLLLLDGMLLVLLYRQLIWRFLRRRAPVAAEALRLVVVRLGQLLGSGLDVLWLSITGSGQDRGHGPTRPRRRPSSRQRRPPRRWRGRAAATHPRRVTEMVSAGDRSRRSIYDDFSF
ncbi:MAG: N-acetylmuramoyl-L-alanine amidase family protein [Candidatus Dormibacteria bacterium]